MHSIYELEPGNGSGERRGWTEYFGQLGLDTEHALRFPPVIPDEENLMLTPAERERYEGSYPPEMVAMVDLLEQSVVTEDEVPSRRLVNGLTHSLQTGTRALQSRAPRSEVVLAVVHDSMRLLSPDHHERVAAALMQDRLPADHVTVLLNHSEFQTDIINGTQKTDRYKAEPWFKLAKRLAKWDGDSFDPTYPTRPLGFFLPMIQAECYPNLIGIRLRR